jgi:hypothetical protein
MDLPHAWYIHLLVERRACKHFLSFLMHSSLSLCLAKFDLIFYRFLYFLSTSPLNGKRRVRSVLLFPV